MEQTLDLKGMLAVLTPEGLQDVLEAIDGVERAEVEPATGRTRLAYDEQRTGLRAIRSHLLECGYHCAAEALPDELCDARAAHRV